MVVLSAMMLTASAQEDSRAVQGYDVDQYFRQKPTYDIQQFVRTRDTYDVEMYFRQKPLYDVQAY
ncbi:MAG: hypothetical protein NQU42_04520, partial [Methanothrix sp.]|uniref:hypothetical protein n=1 Tax=Methanothrix sp. TaxID=90426 RepID=UPI0025CDC18B